MANFISSYNSCVCILREQLHEAKDPFCAACFVHTLFQCTSLQKTLVKCYVQYSHVWTEAQQT